ncbi:Hypothetical protein ETEE_0028 [Edwardsiella anguillarum ET080813]|uniref:Uncharacterized protein n=1 Tax=Edwardsiella anguillarum ET080813 TaxID=667120 RepID=A0A076LLI8_9GAMM|nr:Hypothetical protein ETEE_0028 [Edwardsiella anguillarum ET080813]
MIYRQVGLFLCLPVARTDKSKAPVANLSPFAILRDRPAIIFAIF